MNSSIFNSKSRYKRYLAAFVIFFCLYIISFILFVASPSLFYFRAWEYFEEIGWCIPNHLQCEGYERGDASRKYCFNFQDKWKTRVSCDEEGFRSVPFRAEQFPIVIVGDSHTWGTGFSDEETIPWKIATDLNLPVFNGGRKPFMLHKLLQNPRVKDARVIVEFISEHLFTKDIFPDGSLFNETEFEIFAKEKSFTHFFNIHPKRFFFPLKLLRYVNINFNFKKILKNKLKKNEFDPYLVQYNKHYTLKRYFQNDLEIIVEKIVKRSTALNQLGYQYVLGVIPARNEHLSYFRDHEGEALEAELAKRLKECGVHYVDSCATFRKHPYPRLLWFATDCHMNSVEAALIS